QSGADGRRRAFRCGDGTQLALGTATERLEPVRDIAVRVRAVPQVGFEAFEVAEGPVRPFDCCRACCDSVLGLSDEVVLMSLHHLP
ncbi:hypothetical protein, partial [Streptomyces sp. GbtcB7]|uniref:hypothetical protein n=1 Tax=Streptomyces sp. GbtcB7 TaxID=2824752 RepID=UPI001C2FE988